MKRFAQKFTVLSGILFASAGLALAGPDETAENNNAKNLARMNCGAQIECTTPDGRVVAVANATDQNKDAAALIMDDDTLSCPLQEGHTTFVIKLPSTSTLDRFTFVNENATAAGQLKISVSNYQLPAESEKWVAVDGQIAFSKKRLFNVSMVGVEARYVKLAFDVEKGGRIAALGLYGAESLQAYSDRNLHIVRNGRASALENAYSRVAHKSSSVTMEDSLNFDFANLYAHARVVYVSSGAPRASAKMIDDDTGTAFKFAQDDEHPLAIVELAENERIHRVSALYKMQSGRLDVYLLEHLAADRNDLSEANLIASVTDTKHTGKAAVNFDPQGARFIALRWTPDRASVNEGFEVAEINAFGEVPLSVLSVTALPGLVASSGVMTTRPSFPAELPTLPVVSP